ncbi:MAG: hypothetical protein M3P23_14010 [Actinomycetota bacterium]|nr:hypothetical protein [Actinomycetota bacterium]
MVPVASRLRVLAVLAAVTGLVMSTTPAFAVASPTPAKTWGTNGRVAVLLSVGGNVVLGGDFTSVVDTAGNSYPASRLAVISASTGIVNRAWTGGADGTVTALAATGNTLFVGGYFSKVDGVSHRSVAAISLSTGALISTFRTTANKPVQGLAVAGSSLILGGTFTSLTDATRTTSRSFLAKASTATGAVDQTWAPRADAQVRAVKAATDGSKVFIGGDFTTVNGASNKSTAALAVAGSGALVSGYHGGPTNNNKFAPVLDMQLVGTTLLVAAGGGGGGCTALSATTGSKIWGKHTNGNVQAVVYGHGIVYCGGHFGGSGSFDGQTRYKIAAVSAYAPYATTSYAPRFNSTLGIWALAADTGHLFAGGDFTKVNQATHNHYASFTDSP